MTRKTFDTFLESFILFEDDKQFEWGKHISSSRARSLLPVLSHFRFKHDLGNSLLPIELPHSTLQKS